MSKYIKELGDFIEETKICTCGKPWLFLLTIRDCLNFLKERKDNDFEEKEGDLNSPYLNKENLFIYYVLDTWDLTEHGGSIGGSWLSDKGERLLKVLNSLPLENDMFDFDEYVEDNSGT